MGGILILGGARSGKSSFAENLAKSFSDQVLYVATAIPFDEGMKDRIRKHQESRPLQWNTVELYSEFQVIQTLEKFKASEVVLLDCITVMVTNLMLDQAVDYDQVTHEELDKIESKIFIELEMLLKVLDSSDKQYILVSNEVGLGLVPPYKLGNYFRDIAGRVNQRIAAFVGDVYFVVSGIPLKIK
jgi:adenosylcobinamide kinase/adenosylcobinamide-phosphate guanylyltransferase